MLSGVRMKRRKNEIVVFPKQKTELPTARASTGLSNFINNQFNHQLLFENRNKVVFFEKYFSLKQYLSVS